MSNSASHDKIPCRIGDRRYPKLRAVFFATAITNNIWGHAVPNSAWIRAEFGIACHNPVPNSALHVIIWRGYPLGLRGFYTICKGHPHQHCIAVDSEHFWEGVPLRTSSDFLRSHIICEGPLDFSGSLPSCTAPRPCDFMRFLGVLHHLQGLPRRLSGDSLTFYKGYPLGFH